MAFQVLELSFELVEELRPLVSRIRAVDRGLADQLMRAANSIVLNIAESRGSDPGNRRARSFTAAGSADESRAALRLAVCWRHIHATMPTRPTPFWIASSPCFGGSRT